MIKNKKSNKLRGNSRRNSHEKINKPRTRKKICTNKKKQDCDKIDIKAIPPNIYGMHAVEQAWLNEQRFIEALYFTAQTEKQFSGVLAQANTQKLKRPEPIIIDKETLDKAFPRGAVHQGIAIACKPLEELNTQDLIIRTHDKERSIIAILDQVTDPHNVGAIMRSASAFGLDGIIMQIRHAPTIEGVLAKTACGAVEHMPIAYATNLSRALEELQQAGFTALAMDERGEKEVGEINSFRKTVIVLGSEGAGIRPLIKEKCDFLANLPTQGAILSLNVSNAAAITFYAISSKAMS